MAARSWSTRLKGPGLVSDRRPERKITPMLHPSEETYRSILELKTVRRFRPEPVTDQHLAEILEAGRWTGSAKNLQYWAFIVVSDPDQKAAIVGAGDFMTPVVNAPTAIALVRLPGGYDFDTGRVAQNMMLAAASVGVGSCPVTLHKEEVARAVLAIPDDHACRYAIAIGYPDEASERAGRSAQRQWLPQGRKPLEELVHRDRWSSS